MFLQETADVQKKKGLGYENFIIAAWLCRLRQVYVD